MKDRTFGLAVIFLTICEFLTSNMYLALIFMVSALHVCRVRNLVMLALLMASLVTNNYVIGGDRRTPYIRVS